MTSIVDAEQYLFTSESVTEGHPDKMCDQISDAILDAILAADPEARVACETATTTGIVAVLGEITTSTYVEFQTVVRDTIQRDRLHGRPLRLRLPDLRDARLGPRAEPGHQARRRRRARDARQGRPPRPGRRRPGHDVRLRLPRDARADAPADRARPPTGPPPGRGSQERHAPLSPAGRQDAGHGRVRARRAEGGPNRRGRRPARRRSRHGTAARRHRPDRSSARSSRKSCGASSPRST